MGKIAENAIWRCVLMLVAKMGRIRYNRAGTAERQILAEPRQVREGATVGEFLWVFQCASLLLLLWFPVLMRVIKKCRPKAIWQQFLWRGGAICAVLVC